MSNNETNIHIVDPLSEVSRRTRKYLLAVSGLGIAIVKVGIIPSKIAALGIALDNSNQDAFIITVTALVTYFILAFTIYAWSDFVAWRTDVQRFYARNTERIFKAMEPGNLKAKSTFSKEIDEARSGVRFWNGIAFPTSIVRSVFEFIFPLVVSAYAVYVLLKAVNVGT